MMKTVINLLRFYVLADVLVLVLSILQGGQWLLNTQVAFGCSLLITLASFKSYNNLVNSGLKTGAIPDDKFEKYYAEDEEDEKHEAQSEEAPKPEVKMGFKQTLQNLSLSTKSVFSLYRIVSYGVLFLAVMVLIRHQSLDAIAFFVGLSIVPVSSFVSVLFFKKGLNETHE